MADLRLAEPLAALSLVTDLGMGMASESAIRTCLLATHLAHASHLADAEVTDVYYTALLQHIGCTAYAHETAALVGGDDIALRSAGARADDASLGDFFTLLVHGVASDEVPVRRLRSIIRVLLAGPAFPQSLYRANCEVAVRTAARLDLPTGVQHGLATIYGRPDGKGMAIPDDTDIAIPARFAQVAGQAILFQDLGGADNAIESIRSRAGAAFDEEIAHTFVQHGREMLAEVHADDPFLAVLDAEPQPHRRIQTSHLPSLACAFADIADLKSPWLQGHSRGVAATAEAAAHHVGHNDERASQLQIAGSLHDLGRVGVPSGIWDKPAALTTHEWDQVRLHPYHTERILMRSAAFTNVANIASMHHERMDGSGYHRGLTGNELPAEARILAAADTWDAITHDRPHRRAKSSDEAASEMLAEVDLGKLDPDAVNAVLQATGHSTRPSRRKWPGNLTDREVEVLRLAAHGKSNKEIGAMLSISPKTADHHIQHIYDKVGVSTRAGAALFAMEHHLLDSTIQGE